MGIYLSTIHREMDRSLVHYSPFFHFGNLCL
jgi:hypothetical protein